MYSKTLYNYHYVSSPQRYKTCFLHLWNTGSHHVMDFQAVKNQKHLTIPVKCIFGLISCKFDVCSWSCISSGVSRVSSVTSGVQGGLRIRGLFYFIRAHFTSQRWAELVILLSVSFSMLKAHVEEMEISCLVFLTLQSLDVESASSQSPW